MADTTSLFGHWWTPENPSRTFSGTLTQEPLKAPVLTLLDEGVAFVSPPEVLHGSTDKGFVTLIRCTFAGVSISQAVLTRYRVEAAVFGARLTSPDQAWIRRIELEVPALVPLLGVWPLKTKLRLPTHAKRATLTLDHNSFRWKDATNEIIWEYRLTTATDGTSARYAMVPVMSLTDAMPRSLRFWNELLFPINSAIEILTGSKSNPSVVRVWERKNLGRFDRQVNPVTIMQRGVGPASDHAYTRPLANAEVLATNPGGLHDVARRALTLQREQPVFASFLSDAITYPDRPIHNRFMDLMTSLESYDSVVRGLGPVEPERFKAQRATLLRAAKDALPPSDAKFVKRWFPGRSFYSLEDRLRVLATRANVLGAWQLTPASMASVRNDIAHGNAKLRHEDLHGAYEQAFDLARRIALLDLGITPPEG
ncbi:MAG: hypothetical protein ABMA25_11100 [Ilumatobacteraceae bacterium]